MILDIPTMSWLHGACALFYGLFAVLLFLRHQHSRTVFWLGGACLVTALWAGSVALSPDQPFEGVSGWLELARSVAWYGFILHLYRRSTVRNRQPTQAFVTMGLLAVFLIGVMPVFDVLSGRPTFSIWSIGIAARLGFAVCNVLLIENLYFNTAPDYRWHVNLLCVALAGVYLYDVVLYADAVLFRRMSLPLFEGRASITALAAPFIAMAAARNRRWSIDIHVSRSVVFHSATLVASGLLLLGLSLTGEIFRRGGAQWGVVAEVTIIAGGVLMIAVLLTSSSIRSRMQALLVDNFFSRRYDYQREWQRCIETLSAQKGHVALPTRAIRAVAEVVDSPAGLLFVRDPGDAAFLWGGSWNLPAVTAPVLPGNSLIERFRGGEWVVELDSLSDKADLAREVPGLWLGVPLSHRGQQIGFVLVARPRASFKLDREVFALLRIVGRQVASHVAEQRAAETLIETRHLRDHGKRFAFVIHDIKNVSGQLTMLLANAEKHAENPEFQRDMLKTVRASVARITRLLAKVQDREKEIGRTQIVPAERLDDIVAGFRRSHGIHVDIESDGRSAIVAIDGESFDAVVTHLLNNAAEATRPAAASVAVGAADRLADADPTTDTGKDMGTDASGDLAAMAHVGRTIRLRVRHEPVSVIVEVVDHGGGMSPEFIRDELFRPFRSTKPDGHGIGAFQARELLRDAGGDLLVLSRLGEGTTMRLLLPSVRSLLPDPAQGERNAFPGELLPAQVALPAWLSTR